jgi:uncharacterized protein
MKYLLLLIVIALGVLLLKKQFFSSRNKPGVKYTREDDPRTLRETEPMMRCAHCGIFVPRSAAKIVQGRHYCTPEHAKIAEQASVKSDQDSQQ